MNLDSRRAVAEKPLDRWRDEGTGVMTELSFHVDATDTAGELGPDLDEHLGLLQRKA